jgi:hypothetical protein
MRASIHEHNNYLEDFCMKQSTEPFQVHPARRKFNNYTDNLTLASQFHLTLALPRAYSSSARHLR